MPAIDTSGVSPPSYRPFYPLTPGQRFYWHLFHLDPLQAQTYTTRRISGHLDVACFRQAIASAVNSHAALRVCLRLLDDKPTQFPYRHVHVDLDFFDFSSLSPSDREDELALHMHEDSVLIIDPFTVPLLRVVLYRLDDTDHLCSFTISNLVFDGPSENILWTTIIDNYTALRDGKFPVAKKSEYGFFEAILLELKEASRLPPPRGRADSVYRYAEMAEAIRQSLQRRRSGTAERRSFMTSCNCDEEIVIRIRSICRQESTSLYAFLLTVFVVFLRFVANEREFSIGLSSSQRRDECWDKEVIGQLSNKQTLLLTLPENCSYLSVLHGISRMLIESGASISCDGIEEGVCCQYARDERYVLERFVFEERSEVDSALSGGDVHLQDVPEMYTVGRTDMSVYFAESANRVTVALLFFTAGMSKELANSYDDLFMAIVARMLREPHACISELSKSCPSSSPLALPATCAIRRSDAYSGGIDPLLPLSRSNYFRRKMLRKLWKNILHLDRVKDDDDFFKRGGDLYSCLELGYKIERAFHIVVPLFDIVQNPTIALMNCMIKKQQAAMSTEMLVRNSLLQLIAPVRTGGKKRPLFFVPGGSGGAVEFYIYSHIVSFLHNERPLYQFIAKGGDGGIYRPHPNAEQMAKEYIKSMKLVQKCGPYLLAGECIGGFLAYEIAQQLRQQGEEVGLLVLMDTVVNTEHSFYRDQFPQMAQPSFLNDLKSIFLEKFRSDDDFRRNKLYAARKYIDTLMQYKPRPYAGGLHLILSGEGQAIDDYLGWRQFVTGAIERHQVKGDHLGYLREHISELGATLNSILEEGDARR